MKTLGLVGVALALSMAPTAVSAQNDSVGFQGARSVVSAPQINNSGARSWGGRQNGRWIGGHRAPGGYTAYRPAFRGFVLPRYWVQPSFFIGNFSRYGFSAPRSGFGWSRYYDDAVLSDRSGRVYDTVRGVDWDRYDRYDDGNEDYSDSYGYRDDGYSSDGRAFRADDPRVREGVRERDRDGGLGGALVGGAVGAIAGNVIGGRGNRLAGSLIGGGVGALAGLAIDSSDRAGRGVSPRKLSKRERRALERGGDRRLGYDDSVGYGGRWNGTWTGSYDNGPTRVYNGTYDGRYEGSVPRSSGYDDYRGSRETYRTRPYYRQGYYGGGETIVTINSAPVTTTTTHVTEEVTYVSVPVRKRYVAKRTWKPRAKVRCVCR